MAFIVTESVIHNKTKYEPLPGKHIAELYSLAFFLTKYA
jgi:hypothetical protein